MAAPCPTRPAKPPDSPEAPRRLAILLRQTWARLNKGFRERIEHLELTPFQFSILRWLSESPGEGLLQWELVLLMSSDPNTVSSALNRMEKLRFIERVAVASDRRAGRIRLLAKGAEKFRQAAPIALAYQTRVLGALPKARRAKFLAALETIAGASEAALHQVRKTPPGMTAS